MPASCGINISLCLGHEPWLDLFLHSLRLVREPRLDNFIPLSPAAGELPYINLHHFFPSVTCSSRFSSWPLPFSRGLALSVRRRLQVPAVWRHVALNVSISRRSSCLVALKISISCLSSSRFWWFRVRPLKFVRPLSASLRASYGPSCIRRRGPEASALSNHPNHIADIKRRKFVTEAH